MVRINKIVEEEGIEAELIAKCEFFNAGTLLSLLLIPKSLRMVLRIDFNDRFPFPAPRNSFPSDIVLNCLRVIFLA